LTNVGSSASALISTENGVMKTDWRRTVVGLLLFGISFGYVEAAVVVYLRTIYDPIRRQVRPDRLATDLFPLITPDQLRAAAPDRAGLLKIEVVREAATLLMLAAVALVSVGVSRPGWLAAFAVAFGTWDLFFYVFLKLLIGWPTSLLTWDVLFLVPVPWAAPVLAPAIVSLSIIGTGLVALFRTVQLEPIHWSGLVLGTSVILFCFTWDFRNISGGGMPHAFPWPLFACGEVLGLGSFLHAIS
jgi:hypothetical protein